MKHMHPRYIIRTEEDIRVAELRHANSPSIKNLRRLSLLRKRLAAYMLKVAPEALAAYRQESLKAANLA